MKELDMVTTLILSILVTSAYTAQEVEDFNDAALIDPYDEIIRDNVAHPAVRNADPEV